MSIGKKLYVGFGLVWPFSSAFPREPFAAFATGVLLVRLRRPRLKGVQTIDTVRLQIMLNRLNLIIFC